MSAKRCTKCGVEKSVGEFSRDRRARDGLHSQCKQCDREYNAKWHAENADRQRESEAKWRAENSLRNANRVQNPDVLKLCAKCGEILPETSFSLNRSQADGLQHKCKDCDTSAYRKACLILHGAPEHTTCHLCGLPNDTDAWVDHLVPQSLGGSDEGANLHWSHARCNISRGNRPLTPAQTSRLPQTCTYTGVLT